MQQKQYLISFLATMKGNKLVVSNMKQLEAGMKRTGHSAKVGTRNTNDFVKALRRVAIVVPVWMAFRAILMTVTRTISEVIKANLELQEGLARIRTVMQGSGASIEADMVGIKRTILDMAVDTRVSIKELAEAFYFLKTAGLSVEETMALFKPTMDAVVGTGVNAKEMARGVAGAYNTMGKSMGENLSLAEKATKIVDVLSYTYATQDVQMGELIQSYTKLAPYLSGLTDSFTDVMTTLGFLNTHLLRAGRTGRLTGRAILQLTKNSDKLASIFGITFDPNAPINFLGTIRKISESLGTTGTITAKQGEAIQRVFATRGAVAVRLLISHFDDLQEAINSAGESASGFAVKIKEARMNTISAQAQRFSNILAVLTNDFITGVYGAGTFAETLKLVNENLKEMRPYIDTTGKRIGWLSHNFSQLVLIMTELTKVQKPKNLLEMYLPGANIFTSLKRLPEALKNIQDMDLGFKGWVEYADGVDKAKVKTEEQRKLLEIVTNTEENLSQVKLDALAEEKESLRHIIALMKSKGASALDIARYKLKALESTKDLLTEEKYSLEVTKAKNQVIEKQTEYRTKLTDMLVNQELELLKIRGASALEIATAKMQIEEIIYGRDDELNQLKKVLDIEKELTKQKEKQNKFSGESIKLWKLAQKYGLSTVIDVTKVIRGEEEYRRLSKKGKKAVKEFFPGRYEQEEAAKFFKTRKGQRIPIKEVTDADIRKAIENIQLRGGIIPQKRFDITRQIEQERKQAGLIQKERIPLSAITVPVDIKNEINISIDSEKVGKKVVDNIIQAIKKDESDLANAIDLRIEKF